MTFPEYPDTMKFASCGINELKLLQVCFREYDCMEVKEFCLSPAELKAIGEHKYFLSVEQGKEVTIDEAMQSFLAKYLQDWRREKQRRDNEEQKEEIEKYKYFRSKEAGYDIGEKTASEEWMQKYADIWREEKESLEQNGFYYVKVIVKNQRGLHLRPTSCIANLAIKFDCDVYVHKSGMVHYNFILNHKKYLNVKSIFSLLGLAALVGEELEFIAIGAEAKPALEAIATMVDSRCEEQ
jgi:phosphotransferase system HPr (HPr) family protein